jgi:hypothetical protein
MFHLSNNIIIPLWVQSYKQWRNQIFYWLSSNLINYENEDLWLGEFCTIFCETIIYPFDGPMSIPCHRVLHSQHFSCHKTNWQCHAVKLIPIWSRTTLKCQSFYATFRLIDVVTWTTKCQFFYATFWSIDVTVKLHVAPKVMDQMVSFFVTWSCKMGKKL